MIEIINLNVSLGGTHILKDINLSIKEENSIIGIFGPNGAGKTTLISVLTGSINNYTGVVKGICAKDISYLPDKPFIYRYMKLEDAIKYYKDAFNDFDSDKAAKLLGKLQNNYIAGVQYWFYPRCRLQAQYTFCNKKGDGQKDSNLIQAQVQVRF